MTKAPKIISSAQQGENKQAIKVPAIKITQDKFTLYVFGMKASEAWPLFTIARRNDDTKEGYQRVLSQARVASVAKFITAKNAIPVSIVVSLSGASYSNGKLLIPSGKDVGWVIDGQHRLAGAHEAALKGTDIELPFVGFADIDEDTQVQQFLTINTEGRGVPKSLLLDLLNRMPNLSPKQIADQRASDIGDALRRDETSVFYNRIVVLGSPDRNQISLNNFARKVAPFVHPDRGRLRQYALERQINIFENYFKAIKLTFVKEWSKPGSIFFKTVGFGAWMNIFPDLFDRCLSEKSGFRVEDITSYLNLVADFDFAQWTSLGSGTKAEQLAAEDMSTELNNALSAVSSDSSDPDIRL